MLWPRKEKDPYWQGLQNGLSQWLHNFSTGPTISAFEVAEAQLHLIWTWLVFKQVHPKIKGTNFSALGRTH
jgi:hypothetical protein